MCSFARATVPHTSNLTTSITRGGRFARMVENTDDFYTDKQNREREQGFFKPSFDGDYRMRFCNMNHSDEGTAKI